MGRISVDRAGVVRAAAQVPSPNCDDRLEGTAITLLVVHGISLPTPGQPIDRHARQRIPLQSEGVGFSYGAQQRKVLNANLPVHEIMAARDNLDVVIQASDILASTQSACFFASSVTMCLWRLE